MSFVFKLVLNFSIIFIASTYGIVYLIGGNNVDPNLKNKKLNVDENRTKEKQNLYFLETKQVANSQESLETKPNIKETKLIAKDLNISKETVDKTKKVKENKEKESDLGLYISNSNRFPTLIPIPVGKNNRLIREKEFEFSKVPRNSKFKDEIIDKLPDNYVAKKFKKYLIFAKRSHELWEIKHRQLIGYLTKNNIFASGSARNGWLTKDSTKNELINYCYRIYLKDPYIGVLGSSNLSDLNSIWNWCTLPQYWGQNKPVNWHK